MQRRKKKIQQALEKEAGAEITVKTPSKSRTVFLAISVVAVIMLIIGGVLYYRSNVAPFQRPVMMIDDTAISMGYFLKRVKLSGSDYVSTLNQLVYEQIIKQEAPRFGIEVTPEDVDNNLLYTAGTSNSENTTADTTMNITEAEFKKWYRQQLDQTRLSDAEYKDLVRTNMLAAGLHQLLADNIPTSSEQIHLNVIVLANSKDAAAAKSRIEAGESFAAVAREVSLDAQSKENGGEIGWVPRGVVPHDDVTFSLDIGIVSDPVVSDPTQPASQYLLFMVSEKAPDREIDEGPLQVLKSRVLYDWLDQEVQYHTIDVTYDFNDTQNQAWIDWQLAKMSPK
ncbi:MAG: peptidylprolyl isomerase [Chloroflexota bacterium]